jgi:hypothetical protein
MYYYYVIKNWLVSKYYSIVGKCVNNQEYSEPLLYVGDGESESESESESEDIDEKKEQK